MAEKLMYATGKVRQQNGKETIVIKHFMLEWSRDGMDNKLRGLQKASKLCDACGQTMINETGWKVCVVTIGSACIMSRFGNPGLFFAGLS